MCEMCGKKPDNDWSRFSDRAKDYKKAQDAYKESQGSQKGKDD